MKHTWTLVGFLALLGSLFIWYRIMMGPVKEVAYIGTFLFIGTIISMGAIFVEWLEDTREL